jgi:hypothetical protein
MVRRKNGKKVLLSKGSREPLGNLCLDITQIVLDYIRIQKQCNVTYPVFIKNTN